MDHLLDIKTGAVGFNKDFQEAGQFGVGITYLNYGEIRRTDIVGDDLGSFVPSDFAFSVIYANRFRGKLHYGASIKYIQSKIDDYASSAMAVDLGIIYHNANQNLDIGFSILNLGRSIDAFVDRRESLPTSYRFGISKRLAHLPFLYSLNLIKFQHDESDLFWGLYWTMGGEFTISKNVFLRGGYHSRGSEEKIASGSSRFAGVSLGLGIRLKKYKIDYGYASYGSIGAINNFTITVPF
jgi:hypothetical protein